MAVLEDQGQDAVWLDDGSFTPDGRALLRTAAVSGILAAGECLTPASDRVYYSSTCWSLREAFFERMLGEAFEVARREVLPSGPRVIRDALSR